LKLERKWHERSHWRKGYEPPRSAYQRLCAPGILPLKERRQLQERYESLDPFDLKDDLEEKFKQILHPPSPNDRPPPQNQRWVFHRGTREQRLKARPSARFISPAHTQKCINIRRPGDESETTCLLSSPRCLLSVSQCDHQF